MIKTIYSRFVFSFRKQVSTTLTGASIWLVGGGLVIGLFGYVFQILMGRMLTVEEYGLFNALMAHTVVLSAPMGALMMMVSRKVSSYRVNREDGSISYLYYSIN